MPDGKEWFLESRKSLAIHVVPSNLCLQLSKLSSYSSLIALREEMYVGDLAVNLIWVLFGV